MSDLHTSCTLAQSALEKGEPREVATRDGGVGGGATEGGGGQEEGGGGGGICDALAVTSTVQRVGVTDKGVSLLARVLGSQLELLDLENEVLVTDVGVNEIIKWCPNMRNLKLQVSRPVL